MTEEPDGLIQNLERNRRAIATLQFKIQGAECTLEKLPTEARDTKLVGRLAKQLR